MRQTCCNLHYNIENNFVLTGIYMYSKGQLKVPFSKLYPKVLKKVVVTSFIEYS